MIHTQGELSNKLKSFSKNLEQILIVADFDFTISYWDHEKPFSTFGFMEQSSFFSNQNKEKIEEINKKYRKLEIDLSIDIKTREKLMENWTLEVFQIYSSSKINKSNFIEMMKEAKGKFFFRQGIIEFFKLIEDYNIYLIIISAGIYESINTILKIFDS